MIIPVDKSVDNFRLSVDKYEYSIMVYLCLWITFRYSPKLQNQHITSNIRRIEGYPYGPATAH